MAAGGVAVNKENSDLQLLPDSDFNSNITAGKMFPHRGILQSELFTSRSQNLVLANCRIQVLGDTANFLSEIG